MFVHLTIENNQITTRISTNDVEISVNSWDICTQQTRKINPLNFLQINNMA